jgi:diadenosine tetraphosphate (Ap4A) HIT family hydrolase
MDISITDCPFCRSLDGGPGASSSPALVTLEVLARTELAGALADNHPISPGHTLIVPARHVADWFDLAISEQTAVLELANTMRERLTSALGPDGWNLGLNVGVAGGQTIGHAHLHLIPRFAGDLPDPRGGVRWIIPELAPYWRS